MGYYATGGGFVRFARKPKKDEAERIYKTLKEWFETVDCYDDGMAYDLCYNGKYYWDFEDTMQRLNNIAPIEEGEISFVGEDDAHWKFVFDPAAEEWAERDGRVVYGDETVISRADTCEFIGQIIDTFEDFLEEKRMDIWNDDKLQSENPAIIYGSDYGELQSSLKKLMCHWGILKL